MNGKTMSLKYRAIKGAAVDYAGSFVTVALNIALIPFFLNTLGPEIYGMWLSIQSIIFLVGILEPGTAVYLTNKFANRLLFADKIQTQLFFSNALFLQVITIILVFLISLTVYMFTFESLFPASHGESVDAVFFITLGAMLFSMLAGIYRAIIISQQYLVAVNMTALANSLTSNILAAWFLSYGIGLSSLAYSQLIATVLFDGSMIIFAKQKFRGTNFKFSCISWRHMLDVLQFVRSFFLIKLGETLRTHYVRLMISRLLGPSQVAAYSVTNKIPELIPAYISKFTSSIFPGLSELFASKKSDRIGFLYIRFFCLILRLSSFGAICVFFMSEPFIKLWVGIDLFAGKGVVILLSFFIVQKTLTSSLGVFIYASGDFAKTPLITLIEVLLSIGASLALYKPFGLFGIILGLVIMSCISTVYYHFHNLKTLEINIAASIRKSLDFVGPPTFFCFLGGFMLFKLWPPDTWAELIFFGIILAIFNVLPREVIILLRETSGSLAKRLILTMSKSIETI